MDKQKALKDIDAALKALEALERAIKDDNQARVMEELWTARRYLLRLNSRVEKEKDNI